MRRLFALRGIAVAVCAAGLACSVTSCGPAKGPAPKAPGAAKGGASAAPLPAKRVFGKGVGALTVKIVTSKGAPVPVRMKAFKSFDQRSSVFQALIPSNISQELPAGTYDLEIESVPQRLVKGVVVPAGKDTVLDLGCLTGSLVVKAISPANKPASYAVKAMVPGTRTVTAATQANKALEIGPGVYDIEIGTVPAILKKDVRVDAGKEQAIDIGMVAGTLVIKAQDEAGKEQRSPYRLRKAGMNDVVATGVSNRPIDVCAGAYDVEVISAPPQSKKGVVIVAGKETVESFTVTAPALPPDLMKTLAAAKAGVMPAKKP